MSKDNDNDNDNDKVTNIVVAGLGGQGVLTATDILADVAVSAGLDVKKSELHGMSQRGGSVSSDVRFGAKVFSPMVPEGEADYLVVISADQVSVNAAALRKDGVGVGVGVLIEPANVDEKKLRNKRSINVALLGALSRHLPFSDEQWIAAIKRNLPEAIHNVNVEAFKLGKSA
jgi:indolepyruvate ferredoxin oxidoreductase, beta subunit